MPASNDSPEPQPVRPSRRSVILAVIPDAVAIAAFAAMGLHHDLPAMGAAGLIMAVLTGRMRPVEVGGRNGGPPPSDGGGMPPSGLLTLFALLPRIAVWHAKGHGA